MTPLAKTFKDRTMPLDGSRLPELLLGHIATLPNLLNPFFV
jgi:hypothetical protein